MTMSKRDALVSDMTKAMKKLADADETTKTQAKFELDTLRLVVGAMQTQEKSGKTSKEFNDDEVEAFLTSQVKTRRDSANLWQEKGVEDRARNENAEADFLSAYLPEPLDEEVVEAFIDIAVAKVDEPSMKSMGVVMKEVKAKVSAFGGSFDGKRLSELVRSRLSA